MRCPACRSTAIRHRSERTAQGYRRFRCGNCGKQFNERSAGLLNRAQYPSDVIALVVLWRLRYKLSLRDLAEMFLIRGLVFSYEAVRDWEAKLTPALAENLRRRRKGKVGRSWYVDETYIRVRGGWRYLYRAIDRAGVLVDVMLSERQRGVGRRCRCCRADERRSAEQCGQRRVQPGGASAGGRRCWRGRRGRAADVKLSYIKYDPPRCGRAAASQKRFSLE
jgi:hypothetical protein